MCLQRNNLLFVLNHQARIFPGASCLSQSHSRQERIRTKLVERRNFKNKTASVQCGLNKNGNLCLRCFNGRREKESRALNTGASQEQSPLSDHFLSCHPPVVTRVSTNTYVKASSQACKPKKAPEKTRHVLNLCYLCDTQMFDTARTRVLPGSGTTWGPLMDASHLHRSSHTISLPLAP